MPDGNTMVAGPKDGDTDQQGKLYSEAEIQKRIDEEVSRLRTNNLALVNEKKEIKENLSQLKEESERIKKIFVDADLDEETATKLLKQAAQDEDARLIAEGKMEEVLSKRTERLRAENQNIVSNKDKIIGELEAKVQSLENIINSNMITTQVQDACTKAGILPHAFNDALLRAKACFTVEDGEIFCYENGEKKYGSDGSSPITPFEWLSDLRQECPHWWNKPAGGGATGTQGHDFSGPNPFETGNLTEQCRIKKLDPDKAEKLRKAAGK